MTIKNADEKQQRTPGIAGLSPRSAMRMYQMFALISRQALYSENFPELSLGAAAMLEELAVLWSKHENLPVLFALHCVREAPHSTMDLSVNALGRLLHRLRQDGWLLLEPSDKDGRTKLVRPTEQTLRYFTIMDRCMALAIEAEHSRSH